MSDNKFLMRQPDAPKNPELNFNELVQRELRLAREKFPAFNSHHEGFAVLKEEVDELWDAVKMNHKALKRDTQIRQEAIQVAAMALRFLYDLCEPKQIKPKKKYYKDPNQMDIEDFIDDTKKEITQVTGLPIGSLQQ